MTCKVDRYMQLTEDQDILDLDEVEFYEVACGCYECSKVYWTDEEVEAVLS